MPLPETHPYLRTTYRVESADGVIDLRIGRLSLEMDRLLAERDGGCYAYVTACNPGAELLTDAENAARHRALAPAVREMGLEALPGESVGDEGDWPPEHSLCIVGMTVAEAVLLGRRFAQDAVVWGEEGGAPTLVPCRDPAEWSVGSPSNPP